MKLVNLARVKHELFSGQITGQNLLSREAQLFVGWVSGSVT
ncbi:hypothetical protein VL20_2772 [Microcystis panniformis FACHB-1757]|uniref:Uncharacterized protein n=1 Tax=Microcystis panniformis FACHB-1757 TaxID=1638788 RepID=A0A0K1S190_9CHRO|nr:hypothetical protein VL20_2771 [Microcystis panniformis FACHB-1757]AKV67826.1 hypothetical protein VL20_2772 [Microcystis panniformis FACHB-1757]